MPRASWPGRGPVLVVAFLALWTIQIQRDGDQDNLDFAAGDLAKSALSLSVWFVCRQLRLDAREHLEGLAHDSHSRCHEPILTIGSARSTLSILVVAFVHALRADTDLRTRELADPFSLYLAFPVAVLGVLAFFQLIPRRKFPSPFWYGAFLQFAGFFIARDAFIGWAVPPYSLLVALGLCNSIFLCLVDVVYGFHRSSSIHLINSVMFAQSCLLHSLSRPSHGISQPYRLRFIGAFQVSSLVEAVQSIVAICIIRQYGAISQGILTALASTILIAVDTWWFTTETPHSEFLGCLIAVVGSGTFILCRQHAVEQRHDLSVSRRRCFAAAMISLVVLGHIIVVVSQSAGSISDLPSIWRKISRPSIDRSDCRFSGSSTLTHAQTITNYTHFNNVLLIVFFSHARYDANLDFHKEVYADYFPNIVYIGPASREDKGFAHSYDVLVDTFQSEEDLSDPQYYKMAGRMAHHMLYTALREYRCYDGYLWVPFDALLNVPRLQQFNQSLFWYHSPWGQPVPNPALGNFPESGLNISRHAPPAMISPNPSVNLTETWRGWGPDWWWGDPHVGVSVCMNAFHKVPTEMRDHLAERNHGQTRLIGGSADTLYIPGRHRKTFMDVLGLFLETNCFLEIATPTTVHLVVPPEEPIQFVDHWWIWQPPFNASFVRQKWAQGFEVDTFHTFHWGERGEDGAWRGDHRHVGDVRHLLRESAYRQGLGDMFIVRTGNDDDDDDDDDGTLH